MKKIMLVLVLGALGATSCSPNQDEKGSKPVDQETHKNGMADAQNTTSGSSDSKEVIVNRLVDEDSIINVVSRNEKKALIFFGSDISFGTRKFETKYLVDPDISSILNEEYILYRRNLEDTTEFPSIDLKTDVQPYFVILGDNGVRLREFVGLPATKEEFIEFLSD